MIISQAVAGLGREEQVEARQIVFRRWCKIPLDQSILFLDSHPFVAQEPGLLIRL